MPKLSTPRSLPTPILKGLPSSPGGNSAPTRASGTRMPARALGAPQTICSGPWAECSPASTLHTRNLSALGCWMASRISATTMPWKTGATGFSSSTSMPDMVRSSARAWVVRGGSQNSRSQDSGNCILRLGKGSFEISEGARRRWLKQTCCGSAELRQKAQIVLEEESQIAHAVAQHGQAVGAHAESETDVALRVQTVVAHHVRMHLPRAGQF